MDNFPIRSQKIVFTIPVLWMFGAFMLATIVCPPPRADEMSTLFTLGVSTTLIPAFALLGFARWASRREFQ
jgi:hypothetical protein